MKLFFIRLFLFLGLAFRVDFSIGEILSYMDSHARGGISKWNYYVTRESKADIYIFGSSRANHHYVSSILKDSLQGDCINCGLDGNGIIYNYAILKSILKRHTPTLIILDVVACFDLETNDNSKYLTWLRPKSDIQEIDSVICEIEPTERFKMMCQCYKWNSKFFYFVKDYLVNRPTGWDNGYAAQYATVTYAPEECRMDSILIDSVKIDFLKRFIKEASSKTKLVVFTSPAYGAMSAKAYNIVDSICREMNVPYFNYYCDSTMVMNQRWFADSFHLNDAGAHVYTRKIVKQLK